MDVLAQAQREAAARDLAALRDAAERTRRDAQFATAIRQDLTRQLDAERAETRSAWALDRLDQVDGEARAAAETAGRAAAQADTDERAARFLAAGLDKDVSAAAVLQRASGIADARGRTEQAERTASENRKKLETLAAVHGGAASASPDQAPIEEPKAAIEEPKAAIEEPKAAGAAAAPPAAAGTAAARAEVSAPLLQMRPPSDQPQLTSADGPPPEPIGRGEAMLRRATAQTEAAAWLGARIQRMIQRQQGDPAALASPDARVAMRALDMRSRNLDAAATTLTALLDQERARLRKVRLGEAPALPDPAFQERIRTANDAFQDAARSVSAALDPVLARMPDEDRAWTQVLRASFDWLVEQRRREAQVRATDAVAGTDPDSGPADSAPPPPVPTPHQRRVLQAAREENPALPPVAPQGEQPRQKSLQAALTAARLNHIAQSGTPSALYALANALLNADGIARDPQRAAGLMQALAEQGYRPAQVRQAEIAMLGDGRPADPAEALAWYRIAAMQGSGAAQRAGAVYAVELSPAVRAEAERILAQWLAMQGQESKPSQDELDRDLAKAIEQQNYQEVERLLKEGADPQALDDSGRTALVGAAWRGRQAIVRLLMEHGVTTDLRDAERRSALLWASINGYPRIADDLLDFGADTEITDTFGATPLIRAAWNGKYAVVERLLSAGADPARRDSEGRTALDRAAASGDRRILRLLGARPGQL